MAKSKEPPLRNACFVLILYFAPVWAVQAQNDAPLPVYDIQSYCNKLASMEGDDDFVRDDCLSQEHDCLGKLQSGWPKIPGKMRTDCREMTESYEASYTTLYYCLVSEIEAEGGTFPDP